MLKVGENDNHRTDNWFHTTPAGISQIEQPFGFIRYCCENRVKITDLISNNKNMTGPTIHKLLQYNGYFHLQVLIISFAPSIVDHVDIHGFRKEP